MNHTMTNEELADAIEFAYQHSGKQEVFGGYNTALREPDDRRIIMLEHLKELLAIQRQRAGMIETGPVGLWQQIPIDDGESK